MNTKRLYTGDLYYNDGLETKDTYKTIIVEKNVLLIKFGNKFINANIIKSKFDLISFYTLLKYYHHVNNSNTLSDFIYKTDNNKKGIFVDKESLKMYSKINDKIDFKRLQKIIISYEFVKNDKILKKTKDKDNNVL